MNKQPEIRRKILSLARSRNITLSDIRHLGSENQVSRARKALCDSGDLIVVGKKVEGLANLLVYAAKNPDPPRPKKWPCGTPKSTGNAFDWRGPQTLYSRKEQVDARSVWRRGADITI